MNIWQIQKDLLDIFDKIEEAGGELTPELETSLAITQESFKEKIKDYTNVINIYNNDLLAIKTEQKRLKDLADRKTKVIERLKSVIIDAIETFGDTKKSGVKYVDYGIGEVSIRKSKSVDVDSNIISEIGKGIAFTVIDADETNQLDVADRINAKTIIDFVAIENKDDDGNITNGYTINEEDLRHTNLELSVKLPISKLLDGEAYPIIKEIAKYTHSFESIASVAKSELKKELEKNGSCAPNIARIVENKSISIK